MNQLQSASDTNLSTSDTPKSLVRRFEVVFLPTSTTPTKKLREIKSEGNCCSQRYFYCRLCHASLPFVRALDIGHLVRIKGIVTRASDVKPQVTVCTYTCEVCGSEIFQEVW